MKTFNIVILIIGFTLGALIILTKIHYTITPNYEVQLSNQGQIIIRLNQATGDTWIRHHEKNTWQEIKEEG